MSAKTEDLRNALATLAVKHGFSLFGITHAGPHPEQAHFSTWLERGYVADMNYLEERAQERLNLQEYFPGAKSVLCFGMPYARVTKPEAIAAPKIAAYAKGRDYHSLMKKRLRKIAAYLEQEVSCNTRICVDTSPLLERVFSFQAGLGWIGKNTCIINKNRGSYFLLGEIITDYAFPADTAATNHCGSCRKCLDACPTNAFPKPYVLDAKKCISYWTIEHRGAIPDNVKEKIGDHLFGCDICQEVCPWNHERNDNTIDPAFDEKFTALERLEQTLQTNPETFGKVFEGSPLKRARWHGMLRNAALVIGNLKLHRYQKSLEQILASSSIDAPLKAQISQSIQKLTKVE